MRLYYFILFITLFSFTSSCIPIKKLTYLQENPYESDTITFLRKKQEPYRLQVNDLLSIRIKALDQEKVGIFNPISLILNDYMEGRGYGYSYGYGYNYGYGSYGNGYHEHVKKKSFIKRIKNKFKSN